MPAQILPFDLDPSFALTKECMKLSEGDKKWLSGVIAREVDSSLATAVESLKPKGATRVTFWLKEWGAISALWAVPLALLGAVIALWNTNATLVSKDSEFQGSTKEKLVNLEKSIARIEAGQTKQALANHASMPLQGFQATLPDLAGTLTKARSDRVPVPLEVVTGIAEKMVSIPEEERKGDYWPVAGELISYRSSLTRGEFSSSPAMLPDCSSAPPHPSTAAEASTGATRIKINPAYYANCEIQIDSTEQMRRIGFLSQNAAGGLLVFKHCLVVYKGGNVEIFSVNVRFDDSLWQFSTPTEPPASGRRFTEKLLASASNSFSLAG